jgi:pimeloyl-ACP methyl ester carboxylesterase
MPDMSPFFDHSGVLVPPSLGRFAKEYWALIADNPPPPPVDGLPSGNGQVVLVLPGFLTTDGLTTKPLRRFLELCGFRAFGWDHGLNWGPTEGALDHLRRRLDALYALHDAKVAVVGVSLGGILARDLGHGKAEKVRHVVTLASPFRLPTASAFEPLIRLLGPFYSNDLKIDRLSSPLTMPSTAFYTEEDGVVAWQSCRSDEPGCVNIRVDSPHMTICRHADVLTALVRRLAPLS